MSTSAKPILPVLNETNAYFAFSEPLPGFRDVPSNERQILFVKKLHLASFTFDFNDATKSVREKEIKRQTLLELVDYVNTGQGKFGEAIYEDIVFMLSHNLFRTLPPGRSSIENEMFDPEEEDAATIQDALKASPLEDPFLEWCTSGGIEVTCSPVVRSLKEENPSAAFASWQDR